MASAFQPLLGMFEITLRNAMHESLSRRCSNDTSLSFPWYDRAQPKSITLKGKSKDKIEEQLYLYSGTNKKVPRSPVPSPDVVIANLSFGFWSNLAESLNDPVGSATFTDVFRFHPASKRQYWSRSASREAVVRRLKRIQDLRNRVAHHEPVWKLYWLRKSGTNWSHSLLGIRELHQQVLETLGWIAPDVVSCYTSSFGYKWVDRLCTSKAVRTFCGSPCQSGELMPFPDSPPGLAAAIALKSSSGPRESATAAPDAQ